MKRKITTKKFATPNLVNNYMNAVFGIINKNYSAIIGDRAQCKKDIKKIVNTFFKTYDVSTQYRSLKKLRSVYKLKYVKNTSDAKICKKLNISKFELRYYNAYFLKKVRYPSRSKKLRKYINKEAY